MHQRFYARVRLRPRCSRRSLARWRSRTEATARLYAYMHDLDTPDYDLILVDPIPNKGIGIALNDRLKRASIKALP